MYIVDSRDQVLVHEGFPRSCAGAPLPVVVAAEGQLFLAYFTEPVDRRWDGRSPRSVALDTEGQPIALATFRRPYAHFFGPPNDEAFAGHPLAARGLHPYDAFEIRDSSWVRALERMNSVHPQHRPDDFAQLRHCIVAFHDSTFECIAESVATEMHVGSMGSVLGVMTQRICEAAS